MYRPPTFGSAEPSPRSSARVDSFDVAATPLHPTDATPGSRRSTGLPSPAAYIVLWFVADTLSGGHVLSLNVAGSPGSCFPDHVSVMLHENSSMRDTSS